MPEGERITEKQLKYLLTLIDKRIKEFGSLKESGREVEIQEKRLEFLQELRIKAKELSKRQASICIDVLTRPMYYTRVYPKFCDFTEYLRNNLGWV